VSIAIGTLALARFAARKAVKRQLRAKGLRPTHIPPRQINVLANAYLAAHPELLAEARALVERWTAEGVFGKRAQRAALAQAPSEAPR
jgi:citrate lyase beta subunit